MRRVLLSCKPPLASIGALLGPRRNRSMGDSFCTMRQMRAQRVHEYLISRGLLRPIELGTLLYKVATSLWLHPPPPICFYLIYLCRIVALVSRTVAEGPRTIDNVFSAWAESLAPNGVASLIKPSVEELRIDSPSGRSVS